MHPAPVAGRMSVADERRPTHQAQCPVGRDLELVSAVLCGSRSVLECRDPLLLGDGSQLGGTLKVSPSRMTVSKPVEVFRGADERVGRTQMGSLGPLFGELYSLPIHTPMLRLGTSGF